jgi:hypothetical protein
VAFYNKVKLSVIMLNIVMLSVVAPCTKNLMKNVQSKSKIAMGCFDHQKIS